MPRLSGVPKEDVEPDLKRIMQNQQERYGSVLYNHSVLARRPSIFRGFRAMWDGLDTSGLLPVRLVDLVNIKSRLAGRMRSVNRD